MFVFGMHEWMPYKKFRERNGYMKNLYHINTPYLPEGNTAVMIGDCSADGIVVIPPPMLKILPIGLRKHADLGICVLGGKKAVCPPETAKYYTDVLLPYGIEIITGETHIGCHYPQDCAYNVGIAGRKCFLNRNVCDGVLLYELEKAGYEIIHIKQGYGKCSICPIDENTIISGDKGICRTAREYGFTVLEISHSGIILTGYENGFFGGAAGMLSPKEIAVNGELSYIPDGEKILKFLKERDISVKNLKKGEICDIGSVIPLMIDVHNI